ncbi:MAG: hypothetical protein ACR2RL_07120, partial [Gammaproteobacteria bacterium]
MSLRDPGLHCEVLGMEAGIAQRHRRDLDARLRVQTPGVTLPGLIEKLPVFEQIIETQLRYSG